MATARKPRKAPKRLQVDGKLKQREAVLAIYRDMGPLSIAELQTGEGTLGDCGVACPHLERWSRIHDWTARVKLTTRQSRKDECRVWRSRRLSWRVPNWTRLTRCCRLPASADEGNICCACRDEAG